MIYTVRKPFQCRDNQFERFGITGRVLVIGIAEDALLSQNPFKFKIGTNPKIYSGDSDRAYQTSDPWKNPKGVKVRIVPVQLFEVEES
jgi:hypothetical protein